MANMPQSDDKVLLHGDADAIKEFVFETSSLPQIRGGSQLLIECERKIQTLIKDLGGEKIYCGGGSFLFEVPKTQAETLKQEIESIYHETTLASTVTVVYEPNVPTSPLKAPEDGWAVRLWNTLPKQSFQPDGQFAQRISILAYYVRAAKTFRQNAPFFESLPFGQRCEVCGKRMAVHQEYRQEPGSRNIPGEPIALCPVCLKRHQEGVIGKAQTRGKFNESFQEYAAPKANQAPDLDHMIRDRRNYLAFVYADGNDIGELLQKAKNREEYRALSQAFEKGTRNALFDTLREVCGSVLDETGRYWPFEIVNIGGDDVTLLIQAGYAWEVAVKFLIRFEEEMQRHLAGRSEKVTASCGIAIADANYPMRYLEQLATDLLQQAKKKAKAQPDKLQSVLDFLWLPNPITSEHAEPLLSRYKYEMNGELIELIARPYTLDQAKQIMEQAISASDWPRTQRHQWGAALERGLWVSLNTIHYNIARRKEEDRHQLVRLLNDVGAIIGADYPSSVARTMWQLDQDGIARTALLDVLELAELRSMRPDVKTQEESE
jgi:hypothetical protein